MIDNSIMEAFADPSKSYRSVPFWSLNGKLEKQEIRKQVQGFAEIGLGGFFLHARDGLETEYLSADWFSCMKAAIDEAEKQGIGAWIYDDDRFPSGHAAGEVTKGHDEFLARVLVAKLYEPGTVPDCKKTCHYYDIELHDRKLVSCNPANEPGTGKTLALTVELTKASGWFNGNGAADLLNPAAVQRFLQVTHERYKQIAGDKFGTVVPGVFTDEPALGAEIGYTAPCVPWTTGFDEYFRAQRGYDLWPYLPMLFYDHAESSKVRHDFWRTIAQRYDEAFVKPCYDWCENNGIAFTGHFLDESSLGRMVYSSGNVMQHYRFQHMPAIDILGRNMTEYNTTCQVSSVARQLGNRLVLVENFGCTGWETTFEEQKRIIDWMLVNGVHVMCHHLFMYTVKGVAKYDFPSSFNYHNAGFAYQKTIEDYTARIASMLHSGKAQRDIAIIHPVSSAWAMTSADHSRLPQIDQIGKACNALIEKFSRSHLPCDLADETLLEEYGRVEGPAFKVNDCTYSIIILPDLCSLFANTIKLLTQFMNAGGRVFNLGGPVSLVEGVPNECSALNEHRNMAFVSAIPDLIQKIEEIVTRHVSVRDTYGNEDTAILSLLVSNDQTDKIFLVNTDADKKHDCTVQLLRTGIVTELNPFSGKSGAQFNLADDGAFSWVLPPLGSALFVIEKNSFDTAKTDEVKREAPSPVYSTALPLRAEFRRSHANALVLDTCEYALTDTTYSDRLHVWQVHRALHTHFGMKQSHGWGGRPRYSYVNSTHEHTTVPVSLKFTFTVIDMPSTPLYAAIEDASQFGFCLNGKLLDSCIDNWYLDRSIDRVPLHNVVIGKNELILTCNYSQKTQLQNMFILGDFAVNANNEITNEPDTLHAGDWCLQGYPFYAGEMQYSWLYESAFPSGRTILDLSNVRATVSLVSVNKKCSIPVLGRFDSMVDVSQYVNSGTNLISITLVASPRNIFGPFHVKREHDWVDPGMFICEGDGYSDAYDVVPFGIMGRVNVYT